jgi:hypothetical protein
VICYNHRISVVDRNRSCNWETRPICAPLRVLDMAELRRQAPCLALQVVLFLFQKRSLSFVAFGTFCGTIVKYKGSRRVNPNESSLWHHLMCRSLFHPGVVTTYENRLSFAFVWGEKIRWVRWRGVSLTLFFGCGGFCVVVGTVSDRFFLGEGVVSMRRTVTGALSTVR